MRTDIRMWWGGRQRGKKGIKRTATGEEGKWKAAGFSVKKGDNTNV